MQWSEVIENPLLQNLPFKIELNRFGQILMSPASNHHGRIQAKLAGLLWGQRPDGEVITECSVDTPDGVKVADVAWASAAFIQKFGYSTPYPKAPELCIEIVSPSNSKIEIAEKIQLYLAQGALEAWVVYEDDAMELFSPSGAMTQSRLAPGFELER